MWIYEKKLQKPVKIAKADPAMAKIIITQLGGPDGETGAAMRYLSQRYAMPNDKVKAVLTDIGTEELGHMEMISAIVHQLTRNLSMDEIRNDAAFDADNKAVAVTQLMLTRIYKSFWIDKIILCDDISPLSDDLSEFLAKLAEEKEEGDKID